MKVSFVTMVDDLIGTLLCQFAMADGQASDAALNMMAFLLRRVWLTYATDSVYNEMGGRALAIARFPATRIE